MYMFWEVTLKFWAKLHFNVMTDKDVRPYALCQFDRDKKDPESNL